MQVALIVGIVVVFAGVLFTFASEMFTVQTTTNSIALQQVHMYNVNGQTYVSANIKNTGNHDIQNIKLKVLLDTDASTDGLQPFVVSLSPSTLGPGVTGSVNANVLYTNGTAFSLQVGEEAPVVLEAVSPDGSVISEPAAIRIR